MHVEYEIYQQQLTMRGRQFTKYSLHQQYESDYTFSKTNNRSAKENIKNLCAVPPKRDFDIRAANISKINGEINELLSLVHERTNKIESVGISEKNEKLNDGFYVYKKKINYLQKMQQIEEGEQMKKLHVRKAEGLVNRSMHEHDNYQNYSFTFKEPPLKQFKRPSPKRPTYRFSQHKIEDNLPISLPSQKIPTVNAIQQYPNQDKSSRNQLKQQRLNDSSQHYAARNKSPNLIMRPNSKYIKQEPKLSDTPNFEQYKQYIGKQPQLERKKDIEVEGEYNISIGEKYRKNQKIEKIYSPISQLNSIVQQDLSSKSLELYDGQQHQKSIDEFEEGQKQRFQELGDQNNVQIQNFNSFKLSPSVLSQPCSANINFQRNQSQFENIRLSQHPDNENSEEDEIRKSSVNVKSQVEDDHPKKEEQEQKKYASSNELKVQYDNKEYQKSQKSQRQISMQDFYEEQLPNPYRPQFQLRVFPCNLNSETIKSYIANRLATVVKADSQLIEYKKLFLENFFDQKYTLSQKKEILIQALSKRGYIIDKEDFDEVISFDVYHLPAIVSNEQRAKLKDFDKFIEIFVDKYLGAEYEWGKKVRNMLSQNQINQTNFKIAKLDLENKGYLKLQDLTCFINLYAENTPCFKNRAVKQLFLRFCRGQPRQDILYYAGFMKNILNITQHHF